MRGRRLPAGQTEKSCSRCDVLLPLADFSPNASMSDGRQARCKSCTAALARERRATAGPSVRRADRTTREAKRRLNMEAVWRWLLEHPCVDCGEADPVVLEFDHVYGAKRKSVSHMIASYSWASIAAEIDKCEVRCANCHRRKTAAQFAWHAYLGRDHVADRRAVLDDAIGVCSLPFDSTNEGATYG